MSKSNTHKSFRAAYLINRYLHERITVRETEELETWLNSSEQNKQLFEELCSAERMETQMQEFENSDAETGWQRLQQKIENRKSNPAKKSDWKIWWRSVAALLVLSIVAWQVLYHTVSNPESEAILTSRYGADVLPGTKKAQLILSDGSAISLDNSPDSVFSENGSAIQRTAGGSLIYTGSSTKHEAAWNILHIPRGGEYMIVLEDGTKVWLNAATSLRYPVQFTGSQRRVELLDGEAYFEVAKNKEKPFIVVANCMEVQAIGTAFDVNIYSDVDSIITATLTEGKVKVLAGGNSNLLLPGEQARVDKTTVKVLPADLETVTGWKNGLFVFNNTPLPEVMSQLSRWYNVNIEYDRRYKEQKFFTGEIKRDVSVSKLLHMMELTGIARFSITGNTILIQPYKQ